MIISAYKLAQEYALKIINEVSIPVDVSSPEAVKKVVKATVDTKFIPASNDLVCDIAYKAVKIIAVEKDQKCTIDIKRYARIEKVHFFGIISARG